MGAEIIVAVGAKTGEELVTHLMGLSQEVNTHLTAAMDGWVRLSAIKVQGELIQSEISHHHVEADKASTAMRHTMANWLQAKKLEGELTASGDLPRPVAATPVSKAVLVLLLAGLLSLLVGSGPTTRGESPVTTNNMAELEIDLVGMADMRANAGDWPGVLKVATVRWPTRVARRKPTTAKSQTEGRMRVSFLSAFLAVALGVQGWAADPPGLAVAGSDPQAASTPGTLSVAAGRFVPLAVAGGKPALLLGNEAGLFELFPLPAGHTVIGVRYDEPAGAKAKRYTFPTGSVTIAVAGDKGGTVTLTSVVNGATAADAPTVAGKLVLTLTAPIPPPPDPQPNPNPQPVPVVGKLFGWVMIEDLNVPFNNRGAVLNAAIAWSDANGINHRTAGKNVVDATGKPPADMVPYLIRAAGKPVPQLFLITAEGKLLYEGPASNDPDAFVALLSQYKGK